MASVHRQSAEDPPKSARAGGRGNWATIVVVVGLLAVVAFAPIARISVGRPTAPSHDVVLPEVPAGSAGGGVQDLPAGLPNDLIVRAPGDVRPLAVQALGEPAGEALLAALAPGSPPLTETAVAEDHGAVYPYEYASLEGLLAALPGTGQTPEVLLLGAALVRLASLPGEDQDAAYPNAGPVAFAVLDRAREGGSCAAQLNLLLLVAADQEGGRDVVRAEAARAAAACPGDPTPQWLLSTYESQSQELPSRIEEPVDPLALGPEDAVPAASLDLVARFPASAAAVSSLADAHVRAGLSLIGEQPFTAREQFRVAVAQYRRAQDLGSRDEDTRPGLARALAELGEGKEALKIAQQLVSQRGESGRLLELVITAAEAAKDFDIAEEAARRLARLGSDAYPAGGPLFPVTGRGSLPAAEGPLSLGVDRYTPFNVRLIDVSEDFGAAGDVEDAAFAPLSRPDFELIGTNASCPGWTWRRDALLAGHAAAVLAAPQETFTDVRPERSGLGCGWLLGSETLLRQLAALEVAQAADGATPGAEGTTLSGTGAEPAPLPDRRQNLLRWAGELERADAVVRDWLRAADPADPLPMLRLGEIQYLRGQLDDAAASFGAAARRTVDGSTPYTVEMFHALYARGATLMAAGRHEEATALLRTVDEDTALVASSYRSSSGSSDVRYDVLSFRVRAELADGKREAGDALAASEHYAAARERFDQFMFYERANLRVERVYANQALVDLKLGRTGAAASDIALALAEDPRNPVFLMTAGFVAERAGHGDLAMRYNRAALESDAGAFPAANDLGVLLARDGEEGAALDVLHRAVGARPDYALGWFNLGVVHARMGPLHLLQAQGAFARAFDLDASLRDRERDLVIDAAIYHTGLDLARPLPPRWTLADIQRREPVAAAGLLAVLLLVVATAKAATQAGGRDLADRWLEPVTAFVERLPLIRRLHWRGWALAATVVVFLLPGLRHPSEGLTGVVAFALGVMAVAAAAMHSRTLVARRVGAAVRQTTWGPGLLFGLGTGVLGTPWAPLPVVAGAPAGGGPASQTATASPAQAVASPSEPWTAPVETPASGAEPSTAPAEAPPAAAEQRVHAAAPVLLALLGLVLFVEVAWSEVPLTRSVAVATLVMAASVLVPVAPMDGEKLGMKGGLLGAGIVGAAVLVALELV